MNNIIKENKKNKKTIGNEENHTRNEKTKKKQEMKNIIREKKKQQKTTIGNEENHKRN